MPLAFWMVLAAGLTPYAATVIAKWGLRDYDNRNPRAWLARQEGARARANAAQTNGFEAFPFFAAAVIVATLQGAPQASLDALAAGFVACRVVYTLAYVTNRPGVRSVVWAAGFASVVGIFALAAGG